MTTDDTIRGLEGLGRFADYSDEDLAGQCRFQARSETLDPDYEKFMRAVALRLDALRTALAQLDEARAEANGWMKIVADVASSVALPSVISATGTTGDMIAYFKGLRARAEAAEARLEELTRERDEARADAVNWKANFKAMAEARTAHLASLEEAKAVLVEAWECIRDGGPTTVTMAKIDAFLHQGGSE